MERKEGEWSAVWEEVALGSGGVSVAGEADRRLTVCSRSESQVILEGEKREAVLMGSERGLSKDGNIWYYVGTRLPFCDKSVVYESYSRA